MVQTSGSSFDDGLLTDFSGLFFEMMMSAAAEEEKAVEK